MVSWISTVGGVLCCFLLAAIMPLTDWRLVFHPDRYHGHHIQRGMFFEGWYYNMMLTDESKTVAVIPGVIINDNDRHSFLIVAYGNMSHYFSLPFEAFQSSSISDEFRVSISREINGQNRTNIFSTNEIIVDIQPNMEDDATESIQMNLTLSSITRPKDLSWLIPGTMGPFSWLSIMQCNHHVISMRHDIYGTIQFGQHRRTNVSGIGYLEKDWGQSFPSTWIWGQANQWISTSPLFASLFFSFAMVPIGFGIELPGFIIIFEHNNRFFHFNSHLLSTVHDFVVDNDTNHLSFTVHDLFLEYKLSISVKFNDANSGALIYAPRHGRMEKFVKEMLDNNTYLDVRLSKLIPTMSTAANDEPFVKDSYQEYVLFEARTQHVALEMNGNVIWLTEQFDTMYRKTYSWYFSLIRTFIQHYKFVLFIMTTILILLFASKLTKIFQTNT